MVPRIFCEEHGETFGGIVVAVLQTKPILSLSILCDREGCRREGGVMAVDANGRQGVVFTNELFTLTGEVSVGELIAAKDLMSTTIYTIK